MTISLNAMLRFLAVAALTLSIGGCGVLAAPCRVTSAALKMVPLVGHAAALPTDACAAVIDP
ncbi:MAG: hypothetical protein H7327_01835 [Herminiimonas sp.]|nr:hypothetical protein [Herminiimonas sp.]